MRKLCAYPNVVLQQWKIFVLFSDCMKDLYCLMSWQLTSFDKHPVCLILPTQQDYQLLILFCFSFCLSVIFLNVFCTFICSPFGIRSPFFEHQSWLHRILLIYFCPKYFSEGMEGFPPRPQFRGPMPQGMMRGMHPGMGPQGQRPPFYPGMQRPPHVEGMPGPGQVCRKTEKKTCVEIDLVIFQIV